MFETIIAYAMLATALLFLAVGLGTLVMGTAAALDQYGERLVLHGGRHSTAH